MKQVTNSEAAILQVDHEPRKDIQIINDEGRAFRYSLNEKRTKSKLLKGAKRIMEFPMIRSKIGNEYFLRFERSLLPHIHSQLIS